MKRRILISVFFLMSFLGCASIQEGFKQVIGISTREIEDARPNAIRDTFAYDYDTCYQKTREILQQIKTYIYLEDRKKGLIAVYISEEDTTPVGLFFKSIDASHTQIEVASPSSFAKELVGSSVFAKLVIALNPLKGEASVKPPTSSP